MESNEFFDVDVADGVVTISMNSPERRNALSLPMLQSLVAVLRETEQSADLKVAVVRGQGPSFCAGYDLSLSARGEYIAGLQTTTDHRRLDDLRRALSEIRDFRKPLIAEVHGYCVAGGTDLLMACDVSVAATDAKFGMPNIRSLGISLLLPLWELVLGGPRSKLLAFTGDTISGEEAARAGLVSRAVEPGNLRSEVIALARRMSMVPSDLLEIAKATLNAKWRSDWESVTVTSTALDAIAHGAPAVTDFWQLASKEGLRVALADRDDKFRARAAESATRSDETE